MGSVAGGSGGANQVEILEYRRRGISGVDQVAEDKVFAKVAVRGHAHGRPSIGAWVVETTAIQNRCAAVCVVVRQSGVERGQSRRTANCGAGSIADDLHVGVPEEVDRLG